jgi:pyruvate formate lyase activating enzyme
MDGGAIMETGTIFNIQRYSIHDGPGIRTTVFFKGCPLGCWWCHNPESQKYGPQLIFRENRCIGCGDCIQACPNNAVAIREFLPDTDGDKCSCCGACAGACPAGAREIIGNTVTTGYLMNEIEKDLVFYDQSGGGVTFSGGEPLMQHEFLAKLLIECRDKDIHTAVDTSGYTNWEVLSALAGVTDLFLYDIKHLDDTMHTKTVGVSNRVILENLKKLAKVHNNINVRVPLVPGINDDDGNVLGTAKFISSLNIRDVNILPYHNTGMDKYGRLGREYRLTDTREPTRELTAKVEEVFTGCGLNVKIGG